MNHTRLIRSLEETCSTNEEIEGLFNQLAEPDTDAGYRREALAKLTAIRRKGRRDGCWRGWYDGQYQTEIQKQAALTGIDTMTIRIELDRDADAILGGGSYTTLDDRGREVPSGSVEDTDALKDDARKHLGPAGLI